MKDYLLTFELHAGNNGSELEIHGSSDGLEKLANDILRLVRNTKDGCFNHDHLMSEAWGGAELTSEAQSADAELLNHVKVYCLKGAQFQK